MLLQRVLITMNEDADLTDWKFPIASEGEAHRLVTLRQEAEEMDLLYKHLCNSGRLVVTEHDDVLEAKKRDEWIDPEEMVEVKR